MAMQKTRVDHLQPGVFVSLPNIGWLNHPFLLNEFCISSAKQIRVLQEMGLKEISWDPARSSATPLAILPLAVEEDFGAMALAGMLDEKRSRIERVRVCREQFARREREYEKDTEAASDILKSFAGRPLVAYAQTKALVLNVLSGLINAESEVIHLVSSKAKDVGQASHSLNVMVLSLLLGKAMRLSEEEMKWLGIGALLHDVGKSEVPPRIVRASASTRTKPEEDFYRAHVAYGIKVVAGVRDLAVPVRNVIACHHECWDGSGYPNRLAAEKIPKLARLVSLANRYDNLCNPFDLKQAKTPAGSITHLFKNEAARFQPELLQIFVKVLGAYPPGSFVALSNGAVGLVIESNSADILHPLLMLHDPEIPRAEAILLDLRETDLDVVSAVSPATLPIGVVEYLAPRGRVDYYIEGAG